jgi:hypothetical protein
LNSNLNVVFIRCASSGMDEPVPAWVLWVAAGGLVLLYHTMKRAPIDHEL